jgi:manganese/iron transport system permease protein
MIELLAEPFTYTYMARAIWVSALVGGLCGLLSCYLMLKGWSLMGDALSHAVVPGVALAYLLGLPYALGAFVAGMLAALAMLIVRTASKLREDAVMGVVFTAFFAIGMLIVAVNPTSVNVQSIVLGNILAISPGDALQVAVIAALALAIIAMFWRQLLLVFFDEAHALSLGMKTLPLKLVFFMTLSAAVVAALQAVGAILVVAMIIAPGATAYLLTDRFGRLLVMAGFIGTATAALGAYISYFVDGATGALIVLLQLAVFLAAFLLAPKHGLLASRRLAQSAGAGHG